MCVIFLKILETSMCLRLARVSKTCLRLFAISESTISALKKIENFSDLKVTL